MRKVMGNHGKHVDVDNKFALNGESRMFQWLYGILYELDIRYNHDFVHTVCLHVCLESELLERT